MLEPLEPFTVPVTCPSCGRPLSVEMQLPALAEQEPTRREIACPCDGCNGTIEPLIRGEILDVWPGHGPKPDGVPETS